MAMRLKPIHEQTIVITGASSGIGLTTARMAAREGARVVLAARSDQALHDLEQEIQKWGGQAVAVQCDVGNEQQVRQVAQTAFERFGGFDTWVNNAGVSIYGRIEEVSLEDARRVFDTNFWGLVIGSRVAAQHLRSRGGGALINIGSTLSERAIPLQGFYVASKHAVKGFTDALRMELEAERAPISVTLIKPAAIDTPYVDHAKNYMAQAPTNPPPVFAPEAVARTILYAATHQVRDVFVGGSAKRLQMMERYAPRVTDLYMERNLFEAQQDTNRPRDARDSLHEPRNDL